MAISKIGIAAASIAAAGAVIAGGAAIATAADNTTPSATSTSSSGSAANNGGSAANGAQGQQAPGQGQGRGGMGGGQDTVVTGSEADKVIAAVKAKDSTATITTVQKDADGSYDAIGTKSGSPVRFDVSADLKTITEGGMGGHGGGMGGPGGSQDTEVTGSEADKVIAAVKAKDSSVTIDTVRKDADGSYDALGTKSGSPVMFDVSADLKTVTENTFAGGPGGGHGMGGPGMGQQGMGQQGSAPGSANGGQTLPGTTNSSAPTN
ncbi:MAG: hypothetical protein U0Q21_13955 [Dermatophilaceae bacterium]